MRKKGFVFTGMLICGVMVLSQAVCGGSESKGGAAAVTITQQSVSAETEAETEAPAPVAGTLYTLEDVDCEGVVLTLTVPDDEGIEVLEFTEEKDGYDEIIIINEQAGWELDILMSVIENWVFEDLDEDEAISFGDNSGYIEFFSKYAGGYLSFAPVPDSDDECYAAYYSVGRADWGEAEEGELEQYLEDETVQAIIASINIEDK